MTATPSTLRILSLFNGGALSQAVAKTRLDAYEKAARPVYKGQNVGLMTEHATFEADGREWFGILTGLMATLRDDGLWNGHMGDLVKVLTKKRFIDGRRSIYL